MILDIETYPNYNLFAFKKGEKIITFESWDRFSDKDIKKIKKLLKNNLIITFNGNKYDIPLVNYAIQKQATVQQMYQMSKKIIEQKMHQYMLYRKLQIKPLPIDHIDLIEPSPAVFIGLKLYGTRLGSKVLWDLPYDPHTKLTKRQAKVIKDYCGNDLQVTEDLYNAIKPILDLRVGMSKKYKIDLRSKSNPQIAETVFINEIEKTYNTTVERPKLSSDYHSMYKPPKYIKFKTPQLKELFKEICETKFYLNNGGNVQLPAKLTQKLIEIGETTYKFGIGGLHSQEKSMVKHGMINADFTSYYPFIILENGYAPKHLGKKFLKLYQGFVDARVKAKTLMKKIVNSSDREIQNTIQAGFKILLNGSFGKYGSKFSKLYSPDLLLQVTLTGQLTLLMLIEKLESKGISVVSANTDGLEMNTDKLKLVTKIIKKLDSKTGYNMEIGQYDSLYARDVNNYVAKYDGYVKAKGVYAEPSLTKNSQTAICFKAVREFINKGTPLKKTIDECKDIKQFLSARNVKGGGEWRGQYLGKVARWYYSTDNDIIQYVKNGNKVALTDGAKPMMTLTDTIPDDLDYEWYYIYADQMLKDLGYVTKV